MNPDQEKNAKQLYTIRYTIMPEQSIQQTALNALVELGEALLEAQMEEDGFPEANQLIAKIKAQL
jgi:hypothetical protein